MYHRRLHHISINRLGEELDFDIICIMGKARCFEGAKSTRIEIPCWYGRPMTSYIIREKKIAPLLFIVPTLSALS